MKRLAVLRALLVIAAVVSTPALALAQQQQYGQTSPDTYVTWGTNQPVSRIDVTYFINPVGSPPPGPPGPPPGPAFSATQMNLIRAAAAAWNNTGTFITLVEVGSAAAANIQFNYVPDPAFVRSTITLNTLPGAGTFPNGDPWAQIQNPVIIDINSNVPWWDGTGLIGPRLDFGAYAVTLMGRGIGLGVAGPGDNPSVMQADGAFGFGVVGLQNPSASDIAAVTAVYGSPEPATFALFAVGLAAFGLSKRLRRR